MARFDLRLSSDEFFALTPRQLDALIQRHERQTQGREFLFAQLCSCIVNFSMTAPEKRVKPADFMPSQWAHQAAKKPKRRTRKEIAAECRDVMQMLMKRNQP